VKADSTTEAAVLAALKKWLETYASRDLEALMGLFKPDPKTIVIGTGADEKRVGLNEIRSQFERDYDQCEAISTELGWYSISTSDSVAWIAGEITFKVKASGQEIGLPTRITTVLELQAGQWLIALWHVSVPSAGQTDGESW
jgi:ketosteroid isomerase-like protein